MRRLPFVHPDHIHLVANICINNILEGQEDAISDKAKSWILYVRVWYTGFWDRTRNEWVQPRFPAQMWSVAGSIVNEDPHTNCSVEGWNSALNRDAPLQPNLWKLILKFRSLESAAMQEWRRQVSIDVLDLTNIVILRPSVWCWKSDQHYKAWLQVSWCQREERQDSAGHHQQQPRPDWVKARKCRDLLWVFADARRSPWSIILFAFFCDHDIFCFGKKWISINVQRSRHRPDPT